MSKTTPRDNRVPLTRVERSGALVAAVGLLVIAVWMTVNPPNHTEALTGCKSAADGCLVSVDGDTTTIAAALVALAAGAALIALLNRRFTSLKAAGVELSYAAETRALRRSSRRSRQRSPPLSHGREALSRTQARARGH